MNENLDVKVRPMRLADVYHIALWGEKHEELWLHNYRYDDFTKERRLPILRACRWFFKRRIPGLRWIFAVEGPEGAVSGYWTVQRRPFARRAELGAALNPSLVGNRIGATSIKQVMQICFSELDLLELWGRVIEVNQRSIRLFTGAGMVHYDSRMDPYDDQSMNERLLQDYPDYFALEDGLLKVRTRYFRVEKEGFAKICRTEQ